MAQKLRHRSRNYVFTMFTDKKDEIEALTKIDKIKYIVGQFEICPKTNNTHFQGYLEMKNPTDFNAVKKILNNAHIEERKGSQAEAIAYCTKKDTSTGIQIEHGIKGTQGSRNDIKQALEMVKDNIPINDIIDEIPQMLRLDKHLERYKQRAILPRNWMTELHILIGPPGSGKTRYVFDNETDIWTMPESSSGTQYFDGYFGQEVVLIDDFKGNIRYNFLLQLVDRYPMQVNVKGGMTQWAPKRIYITSNYEKEEWYLQDISALERRITTEKSMAQKYGTEVGGNTSADFLTELLDMTIDI